MGVLRWLIKKAAVKAKLENDKVTKARKSCHEIHCCACYESVDGEPRKKRPSNPVQRKTVLDTVTSCLDFLPIVFSVLLLSQRNSKPSGRYS